MEITTLIDGEPFTWRVAGAFAWGSGPPLCQLDANRLLTGLGPTGYRIVDLPPGWPATLARGASRLLGLGNRAALTSYHRYTDDSRHQRTIEHTREMSVAELSFSLTPLCAMLGDLLGLRISPDVGMPGQVILRINRPGSSDFNPPHRDGSLAIWADTVNVWIPVAGVDRSTSLPIVPGSHRIAEDECWQTSPGGTTIGGKPYRVPAIGRFRSGRIEMHRAGVKFGQALVFTPFLVHGLAVNLSRDHTRMALEVRLRIVAD